MAVAVLHLSWAELHHELCRLYCIVSHFQNCWQAPCTQRKHSFVSNLAEAQDNLCVLHISEECDPFKGALIRRKLHNPSWQTENPSHNVILPPKFQSQCPTDLWHRSVFSTCVYSAKWSYLVYCCRGTDSCQSLLWVPSMKQEGCLSSALWNAASSELELKNNKPH